MDKINRTNKKVLKGASMKFLIREKFNKSVPEEKREVVKQNLEYFCREIEKNRNNIKDIPKGFWIKKIAGIDNTFEFRINNGDRIFFSLERKKRKDEKTKFTFLLYSSHNHAVDKVKGKKDYNREDFLISHEDFVPTEEETLDESLYLNYNDVITYEIKGDDFFKENQDKKYFYYYLNDQQYDTIIKKAPYFILGSAGSGKSTIILRKILNIEEHNVNEYKRIGYITGNSYLKDNIQDQYEYFRDKSKDKLAEFYTLSEYFRKVLRIDTRNIVNFKRFNQEFLRFSFPGRKKYKLEDENIYFEITGIIEGFMGRGGADNWNKDKECPVLSLEEYCKLSKKYSLLSDDLKKEIYKIYEKYTEWKNKNNLYDHNDLALRCFENEGRFDFLFVDEVQDLTETEIYFLFTLAKRKENIIFAGDIHQMVNFNTFSFDRLKNLYFSNKLDYDLAELRKNYRSTVGIVKLANYLVDVRKKYIGNLGSDDYEEVAISDEGTIIFSNIDDKYAHEFQHDTHTAIVVSNEDEKNELKRKFDIKHRVFTINEIKGLEYKNVLCYKLITNNLWAWEKILSGKVKQDQRYRKYFNTFYVGITRAKKNLVIMEDEKIKNEFLEDIKSFVKPQSSTEEEVEKKKIMEDMTFSSKEDWFEEGKRQYKNGNIEEAQYDFERAGYPTWIYEREIEIDIENYDYDLAIKKLNKMENEIKHPIVFKKKIIDHICLDEKYIKALEYLQKLNITYKVQDIEKEIKKCLDEEIYSTEQIKKLVSLLNSKRNYSLLGDAYFALKNYRKAMEYYNKCSNKEGIKKCRREILRNKFKDIENKDEKIDKLQELIGSKDINKPDRNGMKPLGKAILNENSIDIANMLVDIGANVNDKIKFKNDVVSYIHLIFSSEEPLKWLKFFYEKGADINSESSKKKETPLFYAVAYDNMECVNFLLKKGCDIDHEDIKKETALFYALNNNKVKYFKLLLSKTTDLEKQNKKNMSIKDIFELTLKDRGILGMEKEESKEIREAKLMERMFMNECNRRKHKKISKKSSSTENK